MCSEGRRRPPSAVVHLRPSHRHRGTDVENMMRKEYHTGLQWAKYVDNSRCGLVHGVSVLCYFGENYCTILRLQFSILKGLAPIHYHILLQLPEGGRVLRGFVPGRCQVESAGGLPGGAPSDGAFLPDACYSLQGRHSRLRQVLTKPRPPTVQYSTLLPPQSIYCL